MNLHRRHLDESQRALVAARLATMRQGARTDIASIDAMSQTQAADLLNVSRPSVQRAREVLDHGAPELVADLLIRGDDTRCRSPVLCGAMGQQGAPIED